MVPLFHYLLLLVVMILVVARYELLAFGRANVTSALAHVRLDPALRRQHAYYMRSMAAPISAVYERCAASFSALPLLAARDVQECEHVFLSAIFGAVDETLYQMATVREGSICKLTPRTCCTFLFMNEAALRALTPFTRDTLRREPWLPHKWRIVLVNTSASDGCNGSTVLASRVPKLLPHRLFPRARSWFWSDGKCQLTRHPTDALACFYEAIHFRNASSPCAKTALVTARHPSLTCLFDEADELERNCKAPARPLRAIVDRWRREGVPEHIGHFNGEWSLRRNTRRVAYALNERWWRNFAQHGVMRDQMTLTGTLWMADFMQQHSMGDERPTAELHSYNVREKRTWIYQHMHGANDTLVRCKQLRDEK